MISSLRSISSLVYQAWISILRNIPHSLSEYKMFNMMYNLIYGNRMAVAKKHACQKANVRTICSSPSLIVCILLLGIPASDWNTTHVQHPAIALAGLLQMENCSMYTEYCFRSRISGFFSGNLRSSCPLFQDITVWDGRSSTINLEPEVCSHPYWHGFSRQPLGVW